MADKTVGENIRKFREARGMLQKDLAEKVGKKKGTISNWELGLRDPGADNIKLIAAALEIAPSELIGHNEQVRQDNWFEIICKDDSMLPEFRPGDKVLVERFKKIRSGDFVVAVSDDSQTGDPVIREYIAHNGISVLIPLNRRYMKQHPTAFTILGKVREFTRKL
jgi:transcriptional regulator with XRE-family HTH domain